MTETRDGQVTTWTLPRRPMSARRRLLAMGLMVVGAAVVGGIVWGFFVFGAVVMKLAVVGYFGYLFFMTGFRQWLPSHVIVQCSDAGTVQVIEQSGRTRGEPFIVGLREVMSLEVLQSGVVSGGWLANLLNKGWWDLAIKMDTGERYVIVAGYGAETLAALRDALEGRRAVADRAPAMELVPPAPTERITHREVEGTHVFIFNDRSNRIATGLMLIVLALLPAGLTAYFVAEWREITAIKGVVLAGLGALALLLVVLAIHMFTRKKVLIVTSGAISYARGSRIRRSERYWAREELRDVFLVSAESAGSFRLQSSENNSMGIRLALRNDKRPYLVSGPPLEMTWLTYAIRNIMGFNQEGLNVDEED